MPLFTDIKDVLAEGTAHSDLTMNELVLEIIGVLEASDEVELLKDEMKLVMVIRKPKWRDVPFPSIDTIDGVLHSDGQFDSSMEFEFRMYAQFMDDN